ncbi:MAG: 4Fe-4S binding protein [Bacteriovoracaceae bacterium]|jgi:nitroreductase/NAD-dependent dihydropyrimidine dehydrogenase PreA subunit|nr:4Fe-4S binding protein [Bacteriovoracaceae bacterium]
MIKIDKESCINCTICYEICPDYVFSVDEVEKKDVTVRFADHCCICGHCVSMCPIGAVTHDTLPCDDFVKISKPEIKPLDLQNLIFSRRSVRKYKDKQVEKETINQLIECAAHAGSAGNVQTEGFIVLNDKSFLKKLELVVVDSLWHGGVKFFKGKGLIQKFLSKRFGAKLTYQYQKYHKLIVRRRENNEEEGMIFRNAPAVIAIHGLKANYLAQTNSAIALRNIELMAQTLGLGTCHVGFLVTASNMRTRKINKMLGLDNKRKIYGALMIGYPKYKYKHRIPKQDRKVNTMYSA